MWSDGHHMLRHCLQTWCAERRRGRVAADGRAALEAAGVGMSGGEGAASSAVVVAPRHIWGGRLHGSAEECQWEEGCREGGGVSGGGGAGEVRNAGASPAAPATENARLQRRRPPGKEGPRAESAA